jgi:hypothetical protein
MRPVIVVLVACVATSPVGGAGSQSPAGTTSVQQLIDQLGSTKFSERDKAMKELHARGPAVLPALRQALKSSAAPEVRQRIQLLVNRLEDSELAAKLLEPRRVRLRLKEATVGEAVQELAKRSGYPIHLSDTASAAGRKVTLDTGDTTFWDAFYRLCRAAEVVEDHSLMGPFVGNNDLPKLQNYLHIIKTAPGIHLTVGKAADVPTCLVGSVRIRLLKITAPPDGPLDVVLEVSGEPCLCGLAPAGPVQAIKALDEQGNALATAPPPSAPAPPPNEETGRRLLSYRGSGWVAILLDHTILKGNTFAAASPVGEGPFLTTFRVRPGEKTPRRLKELSGKLTLLTTVEAKAPLVIDDVLRATARSVKAGDGSKLTVEKVGRLQNEDIYVQVTWEKAVGANTLLGLRGSVGGRQVWRNNIELGGDTPDHSPALLSGAPRLLDRDGKGFGLAKWSSQGWTITRSQMVHRLTLVYRPQPGQGPPSRLVSPGQRVVPFEAAFKFTDIQLP